MAALAGGAARRRAAFNLLLRGDPCADTRADPTPEPATDNDRLNYDAVHIDVDDHVMYDPSFQWRDDSAAWPEIGGFNAAEAEEDIFGHGFSIGHGRDDESHGAGTADEIILDAAACAQAPPAGAEPVQTDTAA